jgi:hypothetical protein
MVIPSTTKFAKKMKTHRVDVADIGHRAVAKLTGNGMHVGTMAAVRPQTTMPQPNKLMVLASKSPQLAM